MGDIPRGNRPLSPHLSVYRLPPTAITSIMTRMTGQALVAGLLLVVWWLVAAVTSPSAFALADWVLRSWLGMLVMLGACWALWYHFLAGIRHFFYDAGHLLTIEGGRQSSFALLIGSVVLTLLTAILFAFS